MPQTNALPRPIGATVLVFLVLAALLVLPATVLAAPPVGSSGPLALSPAPAIFPKTTVGRQSPTQALDVVNEGEAGVTVEGVGLEGAEAGAFSFNGSNCAWLQPGDHCKAWVTFT